MVQMVKMVHKVYPAQEVPKEKMAKMVLLVHKVRLELKDKLDLVVNGESMGRLEKLVLKAK